MNHRHRLLRLLGASLLIAATVALAPGRAEAATSFKLRNMEYQQCMEAPDRSVNVVLQLMPCDSGPGFRFWLFDQGPGRVRYLRNVGSNPPLCAEVNQGTSNPGELVDNWYCDENNNYTAEQWEIVRTYTISGRRYVQLRHIGTNMCLDTVGGKDSQLMQWYCDLATLNPAQLWEIRYS